MIPTLAGSRRCSGRRGSRRRRRRPRGCRHAPPQPAGCAFIIQAVTTSRCAPSCIVLSLAVATIAVFRCSIACRLCRRAAHASTLQGNTRCISEISRRPIPDAAAFCATHLNAACRPEHRHDGPEHGPARVAGPARRGEAAGKHRLRLQPGVPLFPSACSYHITIVQGISCRSCLCAP